MCQAHLMRDQFMSGIQLTMTKLRCAKNTYYKLKISKFGGFTTLTLLFYMPPGFFRVAAFGSAKNDILESVNEILNRIGDQKMLL